MNASTKTLLIVLAIAAAAAGGFALGYAAARDPALLRRWAGSVAGGWERLRLAIAEGGDSLSDLWNEARRFARENVEAEAFAAAGAAAAPMGEPEPEPAAPRARRRGKASARKKGARRNQSRSVSTQ